MPGRLLFFDLETTGPADPDPDRDWIVEFAFELLDTGTGELERWSERVNPGEAIPAERTAVHGITDADVAGAPPFAAFAPRVQGLVEGSVLVGYGSRGYDVPILDRELRSADEAGLERDPSGVFIVHPEIDLYAAWQAHEPRDLATAARRFAGAELGDDAHGAEADAGVLRAVLGGMSEAFGLPDAEDLGALIAACAPPGAMDRAGCFRREANGTVVFNFSKNRGKPVDSEPGMLEWVLKQDFPAETRALARRFLEAAGR